jgi:DNA-binding IclR family transcriptional regulator
MIIVYKKVMDVKPQAKAGSAPAVTRAAAILRLLADSEVPLGVNAIARRLDLVPSSCLHILRALAAEELVAFDAASKLYTIDAGILTLARRLLAGDDFARLAAAPLERIARRFDVTAIGVRVTGGRHMVVVTLSPSEVAFRLHVDIGSRFPALISATGRCYAAFGPQPAAALERAFAALRWDRPPTFRQWLDEVAATQRAGFGVDAGNYINGIAIVAAPVLDRAGLMTHGLVAIGVGERLAPEAVAAVGAALKAEAAALSGRLSEAAGAR